MFLSTKGYAGDSGGTVVTCEDIHRAHVHTHVQDFQPNFYKPYGTFVPDFCIPSGKRKVAENWRFGDHIACSIFTRTVSTLKASFDTTLESLQIFSALTWEMNFLSDWFSICF